jgi:hypothetical protein
MSLIFRIVVFTVLVTAGISALPAQTLSFQFKDGSRVEYPISDIRSVTFRNDSMCLNKKDGTKAGLSLLSLGKYQFNNLATAINFPVADKSGNVCVYPNPTAGDLIISYAPEPGPVSIDILDRDGRVVKHIEQKDSLSGNISASWNGNDEAGNALPAGNYICRITSAGSVSTQKIEIIK